jgi:hypothetical protein
MNSITETTLLAIVASHLLADFWLQGDEGVAAKRQFRLSAYLKHAVTQAIAAYAFAGLWLVWQLPIAVFGSHFAIDGLKEATLRWINARDDADRPVARWKFWAIVIDQVLHLAALTAIVTVLDYCGILTVEPYWSALLGCTLWRKGLVIVSGGVLAVFAGGVLVGTLVQPLLQEIRSTRPPNDIAPEQRGLRNGGRFIGQLERALIFLFVLSNQPGGVGFLVAAKSIFRFGELKDNDTRMEAEYIIIGTMLSFIWALSIAWLTQWAMTAV